MSEAALNIAIEAARKAGDIIHRYLPKMGRIAVSKKTRNDYVTEVDRACEYAIVSHIRKLHPDHAILAEEGGADGESDELWIIDPLDGTSNFLHGIPHYAISIAHQVKGRLVAGVIYDPIKEELFTAARGRGAYLNDQRMRVTPRPGLEGAIMATALPFRKRRHLQQSLDTLAAVFTEVEDIRRAGSAALDLAYVAAGRLDGYWEMGLDRWDIAAGILLVREAGGVVTDFSGNDSLERGGNIIAAPYKVMAALQPIIAKHIP
ncbi:MAG: inositol monophosphatase [Proteobacteria bacterium]|nr:inositol monophosphatase [Pseudomonadota bacterium]